MRYQIINESLTFFLDNPKREAETTASQSFAGTGLSEQQIISIADCLVKKHRGHALGSQQNITTGFLRPFFAYFKTTGISWPTTSSDWQLTIFRFFQFFFLDGSWSQARTGQRMRLWQTKVGGLLEFLIEEEIIPRDIIIPRIDTKQIRSLAQGQPLLGKPHINICDLKDTPNKLLVDVSVGMTDVDYLDSVERECRYLVGVIRNVCQGHWDVLMRDRATGQMLAEQVTDSEIEKALTGPRFGNHLNKQNGLVLYASPSSPQGHNWALAFVRYKITSGSDIGCVSVPALRASPIFRKDTFVDKKSFYVVLGEHTALTREQWQEMQQPAQFYRFAGFLSNIDVAAACCLLIIEHPEFTPESLQDAKLLNVRGKSHLLLTDNNNNSIFSLNKPRCGSRKSVVLTPVSQKLVIDILRSTEPVRKVLKRAGDKTWRYLFLGVTRRNGANGYLGIVEGKAHYLTGGAGLICLTRLYPALVENGLTQGSFDYRRLRNTLGVLRWFETGSILEMSRRLGNTRKVALENYLPPALLHAWNTRIIRRFQNTLIVLAAYDEPYLLEVTDFSHIADLQHFIAQLIVDYPAKTSPLADEVQRRLGSDRQLDSGASAWMLGHLNVRLSPRGFALLYAYKDLVLRTLTQDELDKVDVLSGFAPRQFVEMATFLQHAAESDRIHVSLRESLDVPLLKQVHGEALAIKQGFDAQFSRLAIKHHWVEGI